MNICADAEHEFRLQEKKNKNEMKPKSYKYLMVRFFVFVSLGFLPFPLKSQRTFQVTNLSCSDENMMITEL